MKMDELLKKRKQTETQLANIRGHEFKKGQSGNPNGRPKNRINALLKDVLPKSHMRQLRTELSKEEVDTIEKKVLQLELADLQLLAKMEKTPAYLKALAMAIIIDMKNGKTGTVDRLRDRQYGTIKQNMEVSGGLSFANLLMQSGNDGDDPDLLEEQQGDDYIDEDEI